MPELAELKLTADYINQEAEGHVFRNIRHNPEHQWKKIEDGKWDYYSGLPSPSFYQK